MQVPIGITKRVLLGVDDDFRVRESISRLAESAGYMPRVFSSAEEVLQSGALAEASCLITDVRMPGMDGLELQRRVRIEYPKLPVLFISAHIDDEVRRRALEGGAVEFLYKPFDGELLLRVLDRATDNYSSDIV
jgi:FixJ family two-component response regulator